MEGIHLSLYTHHKNNQPILCMWRVCMKKRKSSAEMKGCNRMASNEELGLHCLFVTFVKRCNMVSWTIKTRTVTALWRHAACKAASCLLCEFRHHVWFMGYVLPGRAQTWRQLLEPGNISLKMGSALSIYSSKAFSLINYQFCAWNKNSNHCFIFKSQIK